MDGRDPIRVEIDDSFWSPRLRMNAGQAIFHQWRQLEKTGCIDNFRIAAGESTGFREGWFFSDSDAYKWLDAACRIQTTHPSPELLDKIGNFVELLARAQQPDGYLYTYNQIHFPGRRWVNLMIEHELYCLGHLIEGCLSHDAIEPREGDRALTIACRAADLLVRELADAGPESTDGHEEIELALIKLYRRTGKQDYLELAARLIERRGRIPHFWQLIRRQELSRRRRREQVDAQRAAYMRAHPEHASFSLPPDNVSKRAQFGRQRWFLSALSGRLFQQHRPVRETRAPVGHAVRFCYLATASAMLARERKDEQLRAALETTWTHMVERRMYVTGGLGSLPDIEGFGRDYELDPEASYSETCAALGSLFWNWEMALLTHEARYADLFEWQLYNAASAGMGEDGTSYLYNNPLLCRGGIERRAWFRVPCCPSNLSRTWAALGQYLFWTEEREVWVHQYVGCRAELRCGPQPRPNGVSQLLRVGLESELPWRGRVRLRLQPEKPLEMTLHIRIPSWTRGYEVRVNGEPWEPLPLPPARQTPVATACGFAPHSSFFVPIRRTWTPGDRVDLHFPMPILVRRPLSQVHGSRGTAAISRGPVVYCLESVDHPAMDILSERVDLASLEARTPQDAEFLGSSSGNVTLTGRTVAGRPLTFIPYYAWANRGPSKMTVMIRA